MTLSRRMRLSASSCLTRVCPCYPLGDHESTDDAENGVFIRPVAPAKEREHTRRRLKVAFLDLLETVKKGKPQLLAFSLGFDGHEADPGMYGRGGLKTEDFRWMVRLLKKLVHDLGHDRLVLILEGGYAVEGGAAGPLACCIREVVSGACREQTCIILSVEQAA